jgi:3-oxoacyl-[acyl-carrier protein] reductase
MSTLTATPEAVAPPLPPARPARFVDQVVIVTGGSRGIGRSVAEAFAAEGADVVLNYGGNHDAARQAREAIEASGRRCLLVPGSVAAPSTATRLVEATLEAFGRVDVLVNNAGIGRDGPLLMLPDNAWREMLDINLHGMFLCCQAVIEPMIARGSGAIVNMSSTAGRRGRAGHVAYAATKGAVIGLTASLAEELGPHGIRVNAIAPGFVATDMVTPLLSRPGLSETLLAATPVRRFGKPEDVAAATLFLASAESGYVTGEVLLMNGGMYML